MPISDPSPSARSTAISPFPCATVGFVGTGILWSPSARDLGMGLRGGLQELEALVRSLVAHATESLSDKTAEQQASLGADLTRCMTTLSGDEIYIRAEGLRDQFGAYCIRFSDATAHAHAARKARMDEALLERLVEALPVAIFTKDPKDGFRMKRVNRCFEETFGVARKNVVGRRDSDLFPPELIEGYRKADEAVFHEKKGVEIDEFIETSRGLRAAKTIKVPLFDEEGNPELLLGILQDVEDLHALIRSAEQASALKSRFLANMSHEIRTPMYGILGMLDAAATDASEEERASALVTAETCARTLLAVINDILDLSKVEEGKLSVTAEPFDLCTMLHSTVSSLEGYGLERDVNIQLTGDVQSSHSSGSKEAPLGRVPLVGDAGRMSQVLTNLLSNAMKYSPEGGTVELAVQRRTLGPSPNGREFVRIEVIDAGSGIPAKDQEMIFAPFGQSALAQGGHYESTGLGLAIVQQIVELLGGRVGVKSEVGEGSTFWVELTLDHGPVEALAGPFGSGPNKAQGDGAELPESRVLVAEDNPVNQRIIRRVLEKAGHEVTIVGDGEAAVDAATSAPSRFDFVLMDIQMPKLDGLAATRLIREAEALRAGADPSAAAIPIIALTANAMKGDDDLCMAAGADGYLTKPMDNEALFRTMAKLDRRPLPRASKAA